jgi:hypothetical protein
MVTLLRPKIRPAPLAGLRELLAGPPMTEWDHNRQTLAEANARNADGGIPNPLYQKGRGGPFTQREQRKSLRTSGEATKHQERLIE